MEKKFFVFLLIILIFTYSFAQTYRYTHTVFSKADTITGVVYGTALFLNSPYYDESDTYSGSLVMDIFMPSGDSLALRPVIIFAHGGGFIEGNRNQDDMMAFCDSFARMGYVTATIDYRQGVYTLNNAELHYSRAVYRGLQDGRTAVRFFKENANTYGVDTSKIYFAGSSAGAFMGLFSIYMDKPEEKPTYANAVNYAEPVSPYNFSGPDLGDYDLDSTYSGTPKAVMALWGAIASPDLITIDNNEPVFLVHGTVDSIVPFDVGSPFGLTTIPATYGSNQINIKLDSLGLTDKLTYFVEGEGHEFYGVTNGAWDNDSTGNQYWDSVMIRAIDFFYNIHKANANFTYTIDSMDVYFYDISDSAVSYIWDFGDATIDTVVNPVHTYSVSGTYTVELYIENEIESWDTISREIQVPNISSTDNRINENHIFYSIENNILNITSNKNINRISIYNIAGRNIINNEYNSKNIKINLNKLSQGVYFVKLDSKIIKVILY